MEDTTDAKSSILLFYRECYIIRSMKDGYIMTNSNKVPNRLINEKPPYLLQHAANPVD